MVKLLDTQKALLNEFIIYFLPKRGNKRKGTSNELDYLSSTLNKVFIQNFGFNLSRQDIIAAFEELEYDIFQKNGQWDADLKDYKPAKKGNSIRKGDGYDDYEAAFIYVDVEQPIVRQLMLSTMTLLPNTGDIKKQQYAIMKRRLELFMPSIK